jgi:MscS family membrane protein
VLRRLEAQLSKTKTLWDDAVIFAARAPLTTAIWLLGLTWAFDIVKVQTEVTLFDVVGPLRSIAVISLIAWFLIRFVHQAENNLVLDHSEKARTRDPLDEESALDEQTISAIAKLLRLSIGITTALVILQTLGFSISGVLAFGGIGGIAVGFAAKDLLANFFGGLMVYLDRPFAVGDWIRSPDQEIEGVVEYIGWRQTRIRTFDKRPLYIPNSTFTHISVENPSRMTNRRIYETIGVRYADAAAVETIVGNVKKMLGEHSDIDQNQTLMVNFNAFNDSSMDFFIYCFTKTTNWEQFHVIKQDVLLKILSIISDANAEVAFPTRVLHIVQEPKEN